MKLKQINIAGAIFTILLGTLLHFTYDISGNSDFVAIFSAVNESIWEHLKLIFFPMIIFSLAEYFVYGKKYANFWACKLVSVLSGMLFITVIFCTYGGVIGKSSAFFNILLFIVAVIFSYLLNYRLLKDGFLSSGLLNKTAILLIIVLFFMFWFFTFYPPLLNIFKDPVTRGYGIWFFCCFFCKIML